MYVYPKLILWLNSSKKEKAVVIAWDINEREESLYSHLWKLKTNISNILLFKDNNCECIWLDNN